MKKNKIALNNGGFMLLETLIVSTVILGTLVFLYVQFVNVKASYEVSFKYNTIPGIFMAKEMSSFLYHLDNNGYTSLQNRVNNAQNGYVQVEKSIINNTADSALFTQMVSRMNIAYVILTNDDLAAIKSYLTNNNSSGSSIFNAKFKKFILNLTTKKTTKKRVIIAFNDETFASVLVGGDL